MASSSAASTTRRVHTHVHRVHTACALRVHCVRTAYALRAHCVRAACACTTLRIYH